GVKIQVPDAGDKISAIRVISERREAGAEIDPNAFENGNGESEISVAVMGEEEAGEESAESTEV
ncbi:MAG TPA: hypothetical protein DHV68_07255, partial [Dehalococcoidia bacterium]|nr:hypothetical protein [Dehalococcoidia bacterium]